jgi:hypothetical protein
MWWCLLVGAVLGGMGLYIAWGLCMIAKRADAALPTQRRQSGCATQNCARRVAEVETDAHRSQGHRLSSWRREGQMWPLRSSLSAGMGNCEELFRCSPSPRITACLWCAGLTGRADLQDVVIGACGACPRGQHDRQPCSDKRAEVA